MIPRILFFLTCSVVALHAQADTSRKIKLRAAALGIVDARDTVWATNGTGKEATPLRLNTRLFGPAVEMRVTGGQLAFYLERKDAEANPLPTPALTVPFAGDSGLIVFLPDKSRYRAFVMPDGEVSPENFVLYNLASLPLAWSFDGGKPEAIPPGGRAIHRAAAGASTAVKIVMKLPDGSLKLIRNTVWQMNGGQREFVFVHGTPEAPAFHHLIASEPLVPAG